MKVLIVQPNENYIKMVKDMGHSYQCINTIGEEVNYDSIDYIMFTGGADVNPKLYNHKKHPTSFVSDYCDSIYIYYYNEAIKYKHIKFVGICRGSQFLCVMAGGKLIQDCKGHAFYGYHLVNVKEEKMLYRVTSTHHQMQYPINVKHEVLVSSNEGFTDIKLSPALYNEDTGLFDGVNTLPIHYEVVWYPEIKALAFQPHPEFNVCYDTLELYKMLFNKFIKGSK